MKIALIGYGKMGKEVEKAALERGHSISIRISRDNAHQIDMITPVNTDVAIEFSTPSSVISNLNYCFRTNIPVVCGTTGWQEKQNDVYEACTKANGSLVHASNFSIGVNLVFEMNEYMARLFNPRNEYQVSIYEAHHVNKLDAPSGTAISLANGIIRNAPKLKQWSLVERDHMVNDDPTTLPVHAERTGAVTGLHEVNYTSAVDMITLRHEAFNRSGFALGAVLAAEWIQGKKGMYTMRDVLFGDRINSDTQ